MNGLRMIPTVREVQKRIGYSFKNARYIWEALQAPGSIVRSGEVQGAKIERHDIGFQRLPDGNRRLATLGDSVLKLALVEEWYKGHEVRERISRIVDDVASNVNLNRIGYANRLDELINKNPAQRKETAHPVTMATTIEAIIGAVYLDSGMKSVAQVMQNLGLIPKLVRRTSSIPVSPSIVESHEESGMTSADSEEKLGVVVKSSQELEKWFREHSTGAQIKPCRDENAQSPS